MCGRFAFYSPREAIAETFGVDVDFPLQPRYNIAPSQDVLVLREAAGHALAPAMLRWGLVPFWAKDPSIGNRMINARAETVAEKPAYRRAFKRQRCVVPADGFYEWRKTDDGKIPCYISARDEHPFGLAGIWESWDKGEEPLETCSILTIGANEFMRPLHHRMPVIVPAAEVADWVDSATDIDMLQAWLRPCEDDYLVYREVSRVVNNPENEGADLIRSR